jgi:GTP-binding protein
MSPRIVIAGRPNVGKSTLFNRLVGRRLALVDDRPGVTRDWREAEAKLDSRTVLLVDTAGLEDRTDDSLEARGQAATDAALAEADLVLLVIDARAGVTALDEHFARLLRRTHDRLILVANKCEGRAAEPGRLEAFALGLGEPVAVSAEHGLGLDQLTEAILEHLGEDASAEAPSTEPDAAVEEERGVIQLAIIGRPNVGKSTLVNRLIGAERMLTGPEAGITRDAIAVDWSYGDRAIRLFDTAGLRRRARVTDRVERLSAGDALTAVRFAHVVVLVVDGEAILDKQDLTLARLVEEEGRALVVAVNKWDAVEDRAAAMTRLRDRLQRSLSQVSGVPTVTISALHGRNLDKLMDAVLQAYDVWNRRVPTAALNRWLQDMTAGHPPPLAQGRRVKLRYATQTKARPPTFLVFANKPEGLPDSYVRYLINALREHFELEGTPIRIQLRKGENPYAKG